MFAQLKKKQSPETEITLSYKSIKDLSYDQKIKVRN